MLTNALRALISMTHIYYILEVIFTSHFLGLFFFFFDNQIKRTNKKRNKQLHSIVSDHIRHARRNLFKPSHLYVKMNSIAGQSVSNLACLPRCVMEFTAFMAIDKCFTSSMMCPI